MKKIARKLIITSLLAVSIIGIMPIGASAEWIKDSKQSYTWVENGVKAQGWKVIDHDWYNFRNDGIMQTGWIKYGESWYYLWSNGTMAHDTWFSNGAFWYYFDSTGKMLTDSATVGNREYDLSTPTFIISNDLGNKVSTTTTTGSAVNTNINTAVK
ncbi:hypothetical protein psyc5s11_51080 [Clostridium gelidum]|uniref:N-acetylmuramoyl-L-alanine amidase n=1 Tax=Clostridium gelidum TaxID=704125 RepID=A0ABN6J404_9CLOT|nr:phage tail protein [Clostridium gelidum]BCZ49041.1 hypothetical protein psyc5s11_51080 [Clostridium gelidum]